MSGSTQHTPQPWRVFSLETVLLLAGIVILTYGIVNRAEVNIFFGVVIIPGVFLLRMVRRKDWAKHWQEMEQEQKLRAEYEARRKAAAEAARKDEQ